MSDALHQAKTIALEAAKSHSLTIRLALLHDLIAEIERLEIELERIELLKPTGRSIKEVS